MEPGSVPDRVYRRQIPESATGDFGQLSWNKEVENENKSKRSAKSSCYPCEDASLRDKKRQLLTGLATAFSEDAIGMAIVFNFIAESCS